MGKYFRHRNRILKDREDVAIWDVLKTKNGDILVLIASEGIYQVSEREKKTGPLGVATQYKRHNYP